MSLTELMRSKKGLTYSMKDIELKLRNGDSVSDDELSQARKFYSHLTEVLGCLGREWHFAFVEANRLFMMCRDYEEARKRKW